MVDLIAIEGICVGKYAVLPFDVEGMDSVGQLNTLKMVPMSSTGRFRSGMRWVHTAMADV